MDFTNEIPSIDRKEWRELLNGKLEVDLKNFFLQMKITQLINLIRIGSIPIDKAVTDIHKLCYKYRKSKDMDTDLKLIFNNETTIAIKEVKTDSNKTILPIQNTPNANPVINNIPSIDRKEWELLLNGELEVNLKNFFLQMKVTQLKAMVKMGNISLTRAINDIHNLCYKYRKAKNMDVDLKHIFNTESTVKEIEINGHQNTVLTQKISKTKPANNIPSIDRKEWRTLLNGELEVNLKNFFLQMKVTQLKNLVKTGNISLDRAVKDIYNLCNKYRKAKNMDADLELIFNNESTNEEIEVTENVIKKDNVFETKPTNNIPSIDRKEWRELLNGELEVDIKNFFLQMKVTQLKNLVKTNTITIDSAVKDIYNLCNKYRKAKNMDNDLKLIFKSEPKKIINKTVDTTSITEQLDTLLIIKKLEKQAKEKNLILDSKIKLYEDLKNKITQERIEMKIDFEKRVNEEIEKIKLSYTEGDEIIEENEEEINDNIEEENTNNKKNFFLNFFKKK